MGTRTEKLRLDFSKGIPSPSLPSTTTEISKQSQDSYLVFSKQTALLLSFHWSQDMSPWVCSVTDHRRRQNVVRTLVTNSPNSLCATLFFLSTTFWCRLWPITKQTNGNMEPICHSLSNSYHCLLKTLSIFLHISFQIPANSATETALILLSLVGFYCF